MEHIIFNTELGIFGLEAGQFLDHDTLLSLSMFGLFASPLPLLLELPNQLILELNVRTHLHAHLLGLPRLLLHGDSDVLEDPDPVPELCPCGLGLVERETLVGELLPQLETRRTQLHIRLL